MPAQVTNTRVLLLGVENADSTVTGVTTGTSAPIDMSLHGINTFFFRSVGTTSGGTILIEEADWGPLEQVYSGTWSQVVSVAASTFTGGQELAVHVTDSSYRWLRVRISSTIIGGGTITAVLTSRGAA